MAEKFNQIKEAKYQSHKREPLGKGLSRDYQMPTDTHNSDFRFGIKSSQCDNAKDLISPQGGAQEEKPEFAKMYEKTHSNIPAGVQRSRDYDWPVDPKKNAFGLGEKFQPNQAARAVHSERFDGGYPKTVIVKKTVEDVKSVA